MLTSIVAAVVILGLLVIVHEAGHFLVAKRLGVRVIRFSIGYPPKIWGIRRGQTEYSIGATPLGGYVRMLGEEVGEEPRTEELETYLTEVGNDVVQDAIRAGGIDRRGEVDEQLASLAAKIVSAPATAQALVGRSLNALETRLLSEIGSAGSAEKARHLLSANPPAELTSSFEKCSFPTQRLWKRFAIVLAGPASNIIFAPILLAVVFMYGVPEPTTYIGQVSPKSAAEDAGLKPGDHIVSINGSQVGDWMSFSTTVKAGNGAPVHLQIERQEGGALSRKDLTIAPRKTNEKTIYGTTVPQWIIGVSPREAIKRVGPIKAAVEGVRQSVVLTEELVIGIGTIIAGKTPVREALGGPIMIAQMAGQEAKEGFTSVASFMVMLSIELGLINLLPVPLLDGGHLLFFAFEGVRGKPLALRHREIALQVGLFLLVALMAFVIFNDISRIVQG